MTDKKEDILLEVRGINKKFKTSNGYITASRDIGFSVKRGEIMGMVGESGSGKSTIGRIVAGLVFPDGGEILMSGEKIRVGESDIRAKIKETKRRIKDNARILARSKSAEGIANEDRILIENDNDCLLKELEMLNDSLESARTVNRKWYKKAHPDIRIVFQDPTASLNPRMTVEETVGEALLALGIKDKREIYSRVLKILDEVGMPKSALGRYPHEFSGGQKQRIGIARAVITRPTLLIADEPLSALDVSVGAQVANLILDLSEELGMSVLFIAHDLSLVKRICHRVGVMYKGRMVELATRDALFSSPMHQYTQSLLSAIPHPDPRTAKARSRVEILPENYIPRGRFIDIGGGHYVLSEN